MITEVKYIVEHYDGNPSDLNIEFMDDIFTINRKRVIELCNRLYDQVPAFEFGIQTRIDYMDEELLDHLYRAGCRRISYGLESGIPRVLHAMGKVNTSYDPTYSKEAKFLKKFKYIVHESKKRKFEVSVSINLGWMSESWEEGVGTLEFLNSLNVDKYSHCFTMYFAGTEAYRIAAQKVSDKIKHIEDDIGEPVFNINFNSFPELYNYNVYDLPHLKNDMFVYSLKRRRQILQSIMGIGLKHSIYPRIVIVNSSSLKYQWISDNLPLGTCVVFRQEKYDIVSWYFSITPFAYEYFNMNWCQLFGNPGIIRENIAVYGKNVYDNNVEQPGFKVIRIKDSADAYEFVKRTEDLNINQIMNSYTLENEGYLIEDYCCWCGNCTAADLSRLIIKEDKIYTCFNGTPIGSISEELDYVDLANKVIQIREAEYKKRGCLNCKVREYCPKCLFVNHIGVKDYCELQHRIIANRNFKTIYRLKNMEYFYEL